MITKKDRKTGKVYHFNTRELKFFKLWKSGLSATEAYMRVYNPKNRLRAGQSAHVSLKREKFKFMEEDLWESFRKVAPEAFELQKSLMRKEETEDELRNQIAEKILDRAGYSPVLKTAQLKLNVNIDNPFSLKSSDELKDMFLKSTEEIKKLEAKINVSKEERSITEAKVLEKTEGENS